MSALREGFTTGTAAAAAAKAAAQVLSGSVCPTSVEVPVPPGSPLGDARLTIPVTECVFEDDAVRGTVIKDAGDDPDVTHGARIEAVVRSNPALPKDEVRVDGGRGVGRVTRPGLPVAIKHAAINPAPLAQIATAVSEVLDGFAHGVEVVVEVPNGESMAARTLNPRLGIVGGISILGTRGTVKPFSHAAWRATIASGLDVAAAAGLEELGLATGGRSERLLMAALPHLTDTAFIQAADHFAFAMAEAAARGFGRVTWGVFFGKLCKQAQGLPFTHAGQAAVDFELLAGLCAEAGLSQTVCGEVIHANTALHVLELVRGHPAAERLFTLLLARAHDHAAAFSGDDMVVTHLLFDFDGRTLAAYPAAP